MISRENVKFLVDNYYQTTCENFALFLEQEFGDMMLDGIIDEEAEKQLIERENEAEALTFITKLDAYGEDLKEMILLRAMLTSRDHGLTEETYAECMRYFMHHLEETLEGSMKLFEIVSR